MPIVAVGVDRLNDLLGQVSAMDRLVEALEDLGCDVEDTAEVVQYACGRCGAINERTPSEAAPSRCEYCGVEQDEPLAERGRRQVIRLDLQADRPDLFDTGGLVRALRGTVGTARGLPPLAVAPGGLRLSVDPRLEEPSSYRPFIACAEVHVPPLDAEGLRELMRFQESLHWGIGRDRKLASIGVYDLDSIEGPLRYTVIEPEGRRFAPLAFPDRPMTAGEILRDHPKGRAYAHLLDGFERYPLLIDGRDRVLSMPPIINSEETRLRLGSTRLFIDVTGVSAEATRNTLNTLVCSLAELGGQILSVQIEGPDGRIEATPDLRPRRHRLRAAEVRGWLGLDLGEEEIVELLRRMRLGAELVEEGTIEVATPPFRSDIRHPVDLYADVGIGYGYRRVAPLLLPAETPSRERPEERIGRLARQAMVGLGYWEVTSLVLGSEAGLFEAFRLAPTGEHVVVENPKTTASAVARPHLMGGVMETLARNKRRAAPLRFFEEGNVLRLDSTAPTGVAEDRALCMAVMGPAAGFAEIRAATDALCRELGLEATYGPATHPSFVEGRCAQLEGPGAFAGWVGEIHPEVLESFGLPFPVALAHLTLARVL